MGRRCRHPGWRLYGRYCHSTPCTGDSRGRWAGCWCRAPFGSTREGETENAKAAPERDLGDVKVVSVLTMQGLIAYLKAGRSDGVSHTKNTGTSM